MSLFEDDIDLRPYLHALLKRWWWLALGGLLLAVGVFLFTYLQPRTYEARAIILLRRDQYQLVLAEQFTTVQNPQDRRTLIDSYSTIARSSAIAQQVYQSLPAGAAQRYENLELLQKAVSISSSGEAILVTAQASSPVQAAELANIWADVTVQAINAAYDESLSLAKIQDQIQASQDAYQKAQDDLVDFLVTSPIVYLDQELQNANWQLAYHYARLQTLTQLSDQAGALQSQLQAGNQSAAGELGDALAVLYSRALTFSGLKEYRGAANTPYLESGGLINLPSQELGSQSSYQTAPFEMQISDPGSLLDSANNYAADIESLLGLLEAGIAMHQAAIQDLLAGSQDNLSGLAIQSLQAELENQLGRQQEFVSERDLAWQAYQALRQKEIELLTSTSANTQVSFASQAIAPETSISRQTGVKTLIGGVLGMVLVAGWILGKQWWQTMNLPAGTENPHQD
ncbi:MAG: hypothetical protein JW862_17800 [Anaerolineales bacterium]|nr:hypothetical protein [Anaerolineales bacterium]